MNRLGTVKHQYITVAPKEVCTGMTHMESFLQDILDSGGEGIILRDPNAPFESGRSAGYLKHKARLVVIPIFSYMVFPRNIVMPKRELCESSRIINGNVNCTYFFFSFLILIFFWKKGRMEFSLQHRQGLQNF